MSSDSDTHIFFYSDLLSLPKEESDKIPMGVLVALDLPMPSDVLEQFCSDHGRKEEFQEQYGHLNLRELLWQLQSIPAKQLVQATVYEEFQCYPREVSERVAGFQKDGWECIDCRSEVIEQWRKHQTWLRPPILLVGNLVGQGPSLHLVEGHTRLGILAGLVKAGIVDAESTHQAWVGVVRPL